MVKNVLALGIVVMLSPLWVPMAVIRLSWEMADRFLEILSEGL